MKALKLTFFLAALTTAAALLPVRADYTDAQGFKDACTAGTLLERSGISNQVVIAGGEAGCIYSVNGSKFLYTTRGSARINPDVLGSVSLQVVPRNEVLSVGGDRHSMENGCLVFATCQYASYKHNAHIAWAGIIAAQIVAANNNYSGMTAERFGGANGHALTAYETTDRQIFIQEDGMEPRKVDSMTQLAQRGDRSWHDSSTLAYCDHHIQGFTSFRSEFGRPL
jgi:hypothetical protein